MEKLKTAILGILCFSFVIITVLWVNDGTVFGMSLKPTVTSFFLLSILCVSFVVIDKKAERDKKQTFNNFSLMFGNACLITVNSLVIIQLWTVAVAVTILTGGALWLAAILMVALSTLNGSPVLVFPNLSPVLDNPAPQWVNFIFLTFSGFFTTILALVNILNKSTVWRQNFAKDFYNLMISAASFAFPIVMSYLNRDSPPLTNKIFNWGYLVLTFYGLMVLITVFVLYLLFDREKNYKLLTELKKDLELNKNPPETLNNISFPKVIFCCLIICPLVLIAWEWFAKFHFAMLIAPITAFVLHLWASKKFWEWLENFEFIDALAA